MSNNNDWQGRFDAARARHNDAMSFATDARHWEAVEGWQPIATAPSWTPMIVYIPLPNGSEIDAMIMDGSGIFTDVRFAKWHWINPTHWMPLPAPPDDLGIYVPLFTPRFSNVRPACMICYRDGAEFLADVTVDFVDAPKESTDVEPHLCDGHMAEIGERINDTSIPKDILEAYWRIKREQK